MNTTSENIRPSLSINTSVNIAKPQSLGIWDKIFGHEIEHVRFATIAIVLLVVGCLGGITVGLGAVESVVQIALVVVPTMAALTACLAVSPMKWILNLAVLAVVVDIAMIIFNLIG